MHSIPPFLTPKSQSFIKPISVDDSLSSIRTHSGQKLSSKSRRFTFCEFKVPEGALRVEIVLCMKRCALIGIIALLLLIEHF